MADEEMIQRKHTKAAYEVLKTPNMTWKHKLKDILK